MTDEPDLFRNQTVSVSTYSKVSTYYVYKFNQPNVYVYYAGSINGTISLLIHLLYNVTGGTT